MTDFTAFTDEDLALIVREGEHNEYEDDSEDEEYPEWIHAYWDCAACDAKKEIKRRAHLVRQTLPGHSPAGIAVYASIEARDLRPGMVAQYLSRPGTSTYPHEYAEALTVEVGETVVVAWRKTNSPSGVVFTAEYDLEESVRVGSPTMVY